MQDPITLYKALLILADTETNKEQRADFEAKHQEQIKLLREKEREESKRHLTAAKKAAVLNIGSANRILPKDYPLPKRKSWLDKQENPIEINRQFLESIIAPQLRAMLVSGKLPAIALYDRTGERFPIEVGTWDTEYGKMMLAGTVCRVDPNWISQKKLLWMNPDDWRGVPAKAQIDKPDLEAVIFGKRAPSLTTAPQPTRPAVNMLEAENQTTEIERKKNQGGAPEKYDWEEVIAQMLTIANDDGLPDNLSQLANKVADKMAERGRPCPAPNSIRQKYPNLYNYADTKRSIAESMIPSKTPKE